eukprot:SAG25_NODE_1498_length_2897_cov_4.443888_2_plen_80_part_00
MLDESSGADPVTRGTHAHTLDQAVPGVEAAVPAAAAAAATAGPDPAQAGDKDAQPPTICASLVITHHGARAYGSSWSGR